MCTLSALISTSTYFPAFQCVCILIAWEKSIMKEKERSEGRKRKRKCRNVFFTFISFLPPEKKLWFLNCPPNFLGSMSYCITNYYDYSYTMINRDFLNLKTTNQGGQLGIRMSVERKNYKLNKEKESYTGAIIKSILIGFWQHFYSFCVYLEQFYVSCQ